MNRVTMIDLPIKRIIDSQLMSDQDIIAIEQPFTIYVDTVGSYTLLCSPSDLEALTVGFLLSETLIEDSHNIIEMSSIKNDPLSIAVKIEPIDIVKKRNLLITSSCGSCGQKNIEALLTKQDACDQTIKIDPSIIRSLIKKLQQQQNIFLKTGCTHAAAIFDASSNTVSFAEDIGRHNAMDKAIGKAILNHQTTKGLGIVLSGRVSFDMVAKAARAGIEIMLAVSAPTSLAIQVAKQRNITLCGFVRENKVNIYTGSERII